MGFGTLFIGYFLLLNITYFSFTDVLAGLIMTLGLYKMYGINKYFRLALIPSLLFSLLGLAEIIIETVNMFLGAGSQATLLYVLGFVRYAILAILTTLVLLAIETVSREVDLPSLVQKARVSIPFSLTVFICCAIFELPVLGGWFDVKSLTVMGVVLLLASAVIIILNLFTIYKAYMLICMPSDLIYKEKPSRFAFVNRHREEARKKQEEYVQYKLNKKKKK